MLVGALVLVAVAYAGDNGGFSPRAPHSPNAAGIVDVYWYVFVFAAIIFVLVEGTLVFFAVRYRRRKRARTVEGPQVTGHERLEFLWTAIPVLILVAIGTFIFYKLAGIKGVPQA